MLEKKRGDGRKAARAAVSAIKDELNSQEISRAPAIIGSNRFRSSRTLPLSGTLSGIASNTPFAKPAL